MSKLNWKFVGDVDNRNLTHLGRDKMRLYPANAPLKMISPTVWYHDGKFHEIPLTCFFVTLLRPPIQSKQYVYADSNPKQHRILNNHSGEISHIKYVNV